VRFAITEMHGLIRPRGIANAHGIRRNVTNRAILQLFVQKPIWQGSRSALNQRKRSVFWADSFQSYDYNALLHCAISVLSFGQIC
jgi:hypothetical protein